jgi:SAM-dependent methyltransferase
MRIVTRLGALVDELARAHRATSPPPRGLPCLGLEHASGTGLHLLDALAARGIFRKYELVLELGAGLGAASRWLAARLGCEVVGTAIDGEEAAVATDLTRRTRLASQVRFVPAAADALPFRSGRFTHVWAVESLSRFADADAALVEAFRVVRRGGTFAMQEIVTGDRGAVAIPRWHVVSGRDRSDALARAGFVDVEMRDRTADAAERSAQVLAARAQLGRRIATDATLASIAAERDALEAALASGAARVVQLLAHRP